LQFSLFSGLTTYISTHYQKIASDESDRSAAMLTISRWTATLSALAVAIILARLIDSALYGQYTKLWMLYVLFGQVLISAFGTVALQRLGNAKNVGNTLKQQRNMALCLAIATTSALYFLAPYLGTFLQSEAIIGSIRVFSLFVGISVFCSPMEALFIHQKRKKNYLAFSVFYNICTAIIVVTAFWAANDILITAKWMLIMPTLKASYMLAAFSKKIEHTTTKKEQSQGFSIKEEWQLSMGLGLVLFFNAILSIASQDLDRWIVASWFSSDAAFAIYAIGAKKIPFIAALTSSITAALVAHHSFTKSEAAKKAFQDKLQYYVNKLFVPIILLVVFSQLYAEEVIQLLYGETYLPAATYFRWYQWALLGDLLFGLTAFLMANNKRQILAIATSEFTFNVVFSLILLQYFGPIGVIAATVFSHILFSGLAVFIGASLYKLSWKKYFPTKPQWIKLAAICSALIALHFMSTSLFSLNNWLVFGLSSVFCLAFGLHFILQKD